MYIIFVKFYIKNLWLHHFIEETIRDLFTSVFGGTYFGRLPFKIYDQYISVV